MKATSKDKSSQRRFRLKCSNCGHWNRFLVNKIFLEKPSPEPKVKLYVPMYEPLKVVNCKKCGQVIAKPKELIRIVRYRKSNFIFSK